MKLQVKFSIWSLAVIGAIILGGVTLSIQVSEDIKNTAIERAETVNANFIV